MICGCVNNGAYAAICKIFPGGSLSEIRCLTCLHLQMSKASEVKSSSSNMHDSVLLDQNSFKNRPAHRQSVEEHGPSSMEVLTGCLQSPGFPGVKPRTVGLQLVQAAKLLKQQIQVWGTPHELYPACSKP